MVVDDSGLVAVPAVPLQACPSCHGVRLLELEATKLAAFVSAVDDLMAPVSLEDHSMALVLVVLDDSMAFVSLVDESMALGLVVVVVVGSLTRKSVVGG